MKRPKVLLSTSIQAKPSGSVGKNSLAGMNYSSAVVKTGGLPFLAPSLEPKLAQEFIDMADALLLIGGVDVNPIHFGQGPHPEIGFIDEERDLFELELYKLAKDKGIPIFGICRGIQVINIAEGGSLHQHLPDLENTIQHQQRNGDGSPFHMLRLEPNSLLANKYNNLALKTNSYHHQAIDKLADNLKAVAWADDGIIEAVESKTDNFIFGVQWHPEASAVDHPEHLIPFEIFMEAAKESLLVRG